jgi:hypothetical protein
MNKETTCLYPTGLRAPLLARRLRARRILQKKIRVIINSFSLYIKRELLFGPKNSKRPNDIDAYDDPVRRMSRSGINATRAGQLQAKLIGLILQQWHQTRATNRNARLYKLLASAPCIISCLCVCCPVCTACHTH